MHEDRLQWLYLSFDEWNAKVISSLLVIKVYLLKAKIYTIKLDKEIKKHQSLVKWWICFVHETSWYKNVMTTTLNFPNRLIRTKVICPNPSHGRFFYPFQRKMNVFCITSQLPLIFLFLKTKMTVCVYVYLSMSSYWNAYKKKPKHGKTNVSVIRIICWNHHIFMDLFNNV